MITYVKTTQDGRKVEVGTVSTNMTTKSVAFSSGFTAPPVVLTSVMSNTDTKTVNASPFSVSKTGFSVNLQVEKAQAQFDEVEAKKLEKKIRKNQFDFEDFLTQIQQIKKMGNIKDLMGMIPGMGKAMKDVDVPDDAFKGVEAIILSMTPKERSNPGLLNTTRKARIAKGSGTSLQDVNKLMKQFEDMRKMMKMMSNPRNMMGMMNKMKGMGGMPGM